MDDSQMRRALRRKARELGSQRALARAAGVSDAYLSDILINGKTPSNKVLQQVGLRRVKRVVIHYEASE